LSPPSLLLLLPLAAAEVSPLAAVPSAAVDDLRPAAEVAAKIFLT